MTPSEKKQLRAAMKNKKKELTEFIVNFKKTIRPGNAIGSEKSLRKAEEDIQALNSWLSIYKSDHFGKCINCGSAINTDRILLSPACTRCIHCTDI